MRLPSVVVLPILLLGSGTCFRANPTTTSRLELTHASERWLIAMQTSPDAESDKTETAAMQAARMKKQLDLGASDTYVEPPNPALYGGILALVAILLVGKDML